MLETRRRSLHRRTAVGGLADTSSDRYVPGNAIKRTADVVENLLRRCCKEQSHSGARLHEPLGGRVVCQIGSLPPA